MIGVSLGACSATRVCTLLGCTAAATLDVIVVDDPAQLVGATLQVCRNSRCAVGPIPMVPPSPGSMVAALSGDIYAVVEVSAVAGMQGARVTADVFQADDLANGDVYTFSLRSSDGTVLASRTSTATYVEEYPNGPDCGPPCLAAHLSP